MGAYLEKLGISYNETGDVSVLCWGKVVVYIRIGDQYKVLGFRFTPKRG